jgi:hypothetical protein
LSEFPDLVDRYNRLYSRNYAPGQYAEMIQERVDRLKVKHGLPMEPVPVKERKGSVATAGQLALF